MRKNYDPVKARESRKRNGHAAYLQTPEYRKYKKAYDRQRRCKIHYGEFWEAASVLFDLESEIDSRQAKAENNIINKSQRRKRTWQTLQPKTLKTHFGSP